MLAYAAKAITAVILTLLLYVVGDVDVVEGIENEIGAIVTSILVGLGVFAVPNSGVRYD